MKVFEFDVECSCGSRAMGVICMPKRKAAAMDDTELQSRLIDLLRQLEQDWRLSRFQEGTEWGVVARLLQSVQDPVIRKAREEVKRGSDRASDQAV